MCFQGTTSDMIWVHKNRHLTVGIPWEVDLVAVPVANWIVCCDIYYNPPAQTRNYHGVLLTLFIYLWQKNIKKWQCLINNPFVTKKNPQSISFISEKTSKLMATTHSFQEPTWVSTASSIFC